MKVHLRLFGMRVLLALLVAAALPLSHLWFGQDPASADVDGPQAFFFIIAFAAIGTLLALLLLVLGSVAHAVLRRRPRVILWVDAGFGLVVFCWAVYAGVTATYENAP